MDRTSRHTRLARAVRPAMEQLDLRRLFALPILVDFGNYGSLSHANYTETGLYTSTANTTPVHQFGGSGLPGGGGQGTNPYTKSYNQVGAFSTNATNPNLGLFYGDGTVPTTTNGPINLIWGTASGPGAGFVWSTGSTATGAAASGTVPLNSANKEFNQQAYQSTVTQSAAISAIRLTNVPAGVYTIYLTANSTQVDTSPAKDYKLERFAVQVGTNLASYNEALADTTGGLTVDGKFTSPGDYIVQKVAINAGDELIIAGRGLGAQAGLLRWNLLELQPDGTDTTRTQPYANGAATGSVTSSDDTPIRNLNGFADFTGNDGTRQVYGMDYKNMQTWGTLAYDVSQMGTWQKWRGDANHPNRQLVLTVPMFPGGKNRAGTDYYERNSDGTIKKDENGNDIVSLDGQKKWHGPVSFALGVSDPAHSGDGRWDEAWQAFGKRLLENGLDGITVRLGWEMNGNWFPWSIKLDPQGADGYRAYWQHVVDILMNRNTSYPVAAAGTTPQFKFSWAPNVSGDALTGDGNGPTTSSDVRLAYPGDNYVDAIGIDFYDWTTSTLYPSTSVTNKEKVAAEILNDQQGLRFFADFARGGYAAFGRGTSAKPVHLAEWGAADRNVGVSGSGDDNPTFIRAVHDYAADPANNVTLSMYFNIPGNRNHQLAPRLGGKFTKWITDNGKDASGNVTPATQYETYASEFPQAASAFQSLFGETPRPADLTNNWDVGSPASAGSSQYNGSSNTWTLISGGTGVWNAPDQFRFTGKVVNNDQTVITRITSMTNADLTGKNTRGGIMFRDGTTNSATAGFASLTWTANRDIVFDTRNPGSSFANYPRPGIVSSVDGPVWLKLVRTGNVISAFYSTATLTPTPSQWLPVGKPTTVALSAAYQAGLALTANDPARRATATFSNLTIRSLEPQPSTTGTPTYFSGPLLQTAGDVGTPAVQGKIYYGGGVYTVIGGGSDIYSTADKFYFASTPVAGNQTLVTRVDSLTNANAWSKAGLMFRDSDASGGPNSAGAINALVAYTPGNGVTFQWRTAQGGATQKSTVSVTGPVWLKLVRNGNTVTGYYAKPASGLPTSSDWVTVGTQTVTFGSSIHGGLAVSAVTDTVGGTSTAATAVFSSTTLTAGTAGVVLRKVAPTQTTVTASPSAFASGKPIGAWKQIEDEDDHARVWS